jgi:hypothetical protein
LGGDKNVLLVCRGLSELHLLQGLQPQPGCRYIVASDDLRVHQEMEKCPWVSEICFLEQMESFYTVALDAIKFLQLINQWLESLGHDPKGTPRELLFWIQHSEAALTTQRIQELLLLIRSYDYLLDTNNITNVIVFAHPQSGWEDDILIKVSKSRGIEVKIIGSFRLSILKAKLRSLMKFIARDPYYISYILRAKLYGRLKPHRSGISEKEIVFQICSSEKKHVENVLPLMKALKNRGYFPVALHWRASQARKKIQQEGLGWEELETFVPLAALWEAPYRVWLTWRQARRRRNEFLANAELQYHHIALGPLLWPWMRSFFWEELPQRYRLQQAAKQYFAGHSPKAIRAWGGGVISEGAILLKSLNDSQRPLNFFWIMGVFESPYDAGCYSHDLLLAAGESQRQYFEKFGVPPERIVSVGLSRYEHLAKFRQDYSPSQSRAYLNIDQKFQHYFLYDSQAALRGYTTCQEQSKVTKALLIFAREHPSVALMIKPHPSHRPGWLEALIDYFSLPNVFLIDKNMLPYHALNAADLLITKFSTIALEAMLFKKPVVSILLDGEARFRIYGEAVVRADDLEALNEILTMIVSDASRRTAWVENQIKHQEIFLKNYFGNNISESAELGAEALEKFLNNKLPQQVEA